MKPSTLPVDDALSLAAQVRGRARTARSVVLHALEEIQHQDKILNCFTGVFPAQALAQADAVDASIARGEDAGPLAGVPFAVKNLFDVAGLPTLAGSKINRDREPAQRDAAAVARLKAAGAILLGTLNMDEYAYGFTTENTHYGPTRNPHDTDCVAGGSSGGSAAAVAAGLVPLTLGSDTNGSIRVPAAFCGVFGLKPTYGRISRAGSYLFAESLDHVGPLARSVRDLAMSFDLLNGPDVEDSVASKRPAETLLPMIGKGAEGLRIAIAGGYFANQGMPPAFAAVQTAAQALGVTKTIEIPDVEKARAAAYIITACEGSHLHLDDLRKRPQDFDPVVIERFLAGAVLPNAWYLQAQRFRTVFRDRMRRIFETVDVLLAPTTPCPAIRIGQPTITVNGKEVASRPNIGVFTQPLSFVGLPIVSAPIFGKEALPYGVQIIGGAYREVDVLRVAWELERMGIATAPVAAVARAV